MLLPEQISVLEHRASLQEILEFCNLVRVIGGKNDLLDELLPGIPEDSSHCLIARNVNFDLRVEPVFLFENYHDEDTSNLGYVLDESIWGITSKDDYLINKLSKSLNLPIKSYERDKYVLLPARIARAAEAFDASLECPDLFPEFDQYREV